MCDLFSPLGSTSLPGPGNSFGSGVSATAAVLALSHESWESALAVLALALGPLHVIFTDVSNSGSLFPLSTGMLRSFCACILPNNIFFTYNERNVHADGCIAPAALVKAVTCTDAAAGVPSVRNCIIY